MRSQEATILDLDAYRRRRQPEAAAPMKGPPVLWVPVLFWVPMYCLPIP